MSPIWNWDSSKATITLVNIVGQEQERSGTCQDKEVAASFSLLDHVIPRLVRAQVHALHHVSKLLRLQTLQVLVPVQSLHQLLLHTAARTGSKNATSTEEFCQMSSPTDRFARGGWTQRFLVCCE